MGDYNINLLNVESHSLTADFNDLMYSHGLIPLITRPTRVTENSATLIDNIFTNKILNTQEESVQGILVTDISDHYPIFCVNKTIVQKNINVTYTHRVFSAKNKRLFADEMSAVNWHNVFCASDTESAFSGFHDTLINIHNNCFPSRVNTKKYYLRKPWLTSGLCDAIKKKNRLYYKSIKVKCVRTKIEYNVYRRNLRKLLRASEKKYHCDLLSKYKNNSKRLWAVIKNVINKKRKNKFQDKFQLNDGSITSDMKIISNKFNDFFINVGPSLSRKIPNQVSTPESFMKSKALYSLYLEPVSESEIHKLITSLKSASPGYDNISSSILKLSLTSICAPLTHICNMSLQEGIFPDKMKVANVLPLFKCDDPEIFNNYRPVSILCSLSKVFEKIMYNRLINFLDKHQILYSYQFGFRKSHSTYMALTSLWIKL